MRNNASLPSLLNQVWILCVYSNRILLPSWNDKVGSVDSAFDSCQYIKTNVKHLLFTDECIALKLFTRNGKLLPLNLF
jgi:hypothetical protein